jgi:hypothetical protein
MSIDLLWLIFQVLLTSITKPDAGDGALKVSFTLLTIASRWPRK